MPKQTFKVLYTTQLTQRNKRWMDGIATFIPKYRRFELFAVNDAGEPTKSLCCETIMEPEVGLDQTITLTTFLVQTDEELNATASPTPPAPPPATDRPRVPEHRHPQKSRPLLARRGTGDVVAAPVPLARKRTVEEVIRLFTT